MKFLVVALLFATALAGQRGRGGFGGHAGPAGGRPWPGMPGGIGYRGPTGPSHGWTGGYRPGNAGFRVRPAYARPISSSYGYGSTWAWGGGYYPFGWYSAPLWTTPAVYAAPEYYPYNSGPNVTIVTVPSVAALPDSSYAPVPATRPRAYYAPPPAVEQPEPRPLVTESWGYLIAMKDGTLWLARQYSVANQMLDIVTSGNAHRLLRLSDIDRTATEQLNRERGVAVQLP